MVPSTIPSRSRNRPANRATRTRSRPITCAACRSADRSCTILCRACERMVACYRRHHGLIAGRRDPDLNAGLARQLLTQQPDRNPDPWFTVWRWNQKVLAADVKIPQPSRRRSEASRSITIRPCRGCAQPYPLRRTQQFHSHRCAALWRWQQKVGLRRGRPARIAPRDDPAEFRVPDGQISSRAPGNPIDGLDPDRQSGRT